jgi:hypothetical protein
MQTPDRALAQTLLDGGGTFDARTLDRITDGAWAVGGSLTGHTLETRESRELDLAVAFAYIVDTLREDGATIIGTWVDDGVLYVDAIDLITDTDEAIRLARSRGEKAIYHLTDKITLEVSYDG